MKTRTRYNPAGRCSNAQGACERCAEPTGSAALAYCPRCLRTRERAEREARYAARMAARPAVPTPSPSPWDAL